MKINNLENVMVSASEVKIELSEIMSKKMTKVILKNNTPVSVIMPYDEYVAINESADENKKRIVKMGQNFTMNNGVEIMVIAGIGSSFSDDDLSIKMFYKMKESDDFRLFHTFSIGSPSIELTMTPDDLREYYSNKMKNEEV